jgi:hypothetical protein
MSEAHHRKTDRVERWIDLSSPSAEVWAEVGRFADIDAWHPDVKVSDRVEIDGDVHRHLTLTNDAMLLEKLEATGDDYYRYSIVDGPLPVENYLATFTCFEREEGGARVFWSASFDSEDPRADEYVASIFETGLEALRDRFS